MIRALILATILLGCDLEVGINPEPIEIEARLTVVIELGGLDQCQLGYIAIAQYLDDGGRLDLCQTPPTNLECVVGTAPQCGVVFGDGPQGTYCVWPLVAECQWEISEA